MNALGRGKGQGDFAGSERSQEGPHGQGEGAAGKAWSLGPGCAGLAPRDV